MSITGYEELSNEAFVITTSFYLGLRPQRLVQFSHCAHDASSRALVSPWADLAATIVSSSRSAHTVSHNHLRVDGLVCTFMTEASVPTSRSMVPTFDDQQGVEGYQSDSHTTSHKKSHTSASGVLS